MKIMDLVTGRSKLLTAGTGFDWVDDETMIVVSR
jgi:hypothetical protein